MMNKIVDILMVIYTNSVVYVIIQYGTPLLSFVTTILSLFYIVRKLKKEFYTKDK